MRVQVIAVTPRLLYAKEAGFGCNIFPMPGLEDYKGEHNTEDFKLLEVSQKTLQHGEGGHGGGGGEHRLVVFETNSKTLMKITCTQTLNINRTSAQKKYIERKKEENLLQPRAGPYLQTIF